MKFRRSPSTRSKPSRAAAAGHAAAAESAVPLPEPKDAAPKRRARPAPHGGHALGIALGSGSARGWAHVGVLQALHELGIEPAVVCGSSMGALVGAAYMSGRLDELAAWAASLRRRAIFRYMDFRVPGGGLVQGGRLMEALAEFIPETTIEALPRPFAAVATDLATGSEVWLREGSLPDAVRASIAIPGLFTPMAMEGRWLVDGGLVNPVPISLCRALGARVVIGVNPFGDRLARLNQLAGGNGTHPPAADAGGAFRLRGTRGHQAHPAPSVVLMAHPEAQREAERANGKGPGMVDVLAAALNIMQDRITRSRMAGDPPDVLIAPRLSHVSLLEFDRAEEAIAEGRACVQRMLPALQDALGL